MHAKRPREMVNEEEGDMNEMNASRLVQDALDARRSEVVAFRRGWALLPRESIDCGLNLKNDLLAVSDVYIWTPKILSLVADSARSFPHGAELQRSWLHSENFFWWFGEDNLASPRFYSEGGMDRAVFVHGFWLDGRLEIRATFKGKSGVVASWEEGKAWDYERGRIDDKQLLKYTDNPRELRHFLVEAMIAKRVIAASSLWLIQKILVTQPQKRSPSDAKRDAAAGLSGDPKIVALRAKKYAKSDGSRDVEWSCRWIVRGHWRNQYHGDGQNEPTYILPYVKGPDGLPIRLTEKVFAAVR